MQDIPVESNFSSLAPGDACLAIEEPSLPQYNDDIQRCGLLAKGIAGLNLRIEESLTDLQSGITDPRCYLLTMPEICGQRLESVSTIQIRAWSENLPSGMFYSYISKLCKNCVGHWDGDSKSRQDHIIQQLISPFFIWIYAAIVFSFLFSFFTSWLLDDLVKEHPNVDGWIFGTIFGIPFFIGLICFIFVCISDRIWVVGDPIEANRIQLEATSIVSKILDEFSNAKAESLMGEPSPIFVGQFLIKKFYGPAHSLLTSVLKCNTGPFKEEFSLQLTWPIMESVLVLYRFARETSESEIPDIQSLGGLKGNIIKLICQGLFRGEQSTHLQLLRILQNSVVDTKNRQENVKQNRLNLTFFHYLGFEETKTLYNKIRLTLKDASDAKKKPKGDMPPDFEDRKAKIGQLYISIPDFDNDDYRSNVSLFTYFQSH